MSAADAVVLLAEDNASDAELTLEVLAEVLDPRLVYRAHDGSEALDFLFLRGTYAGVPGHPRLRLVLLDIKLPRIGGLEVLTDLRASPQLRFVPVVMLTSSRAERDVSAAYRLGANSYVQKPVEFTHFREVVRSLGRYWLTMNEPALPGAGGGG